MRAALNSRLQYLMLVLLIAALGGCMTAEQKMIVKVDSFMEQQRWDDALGYLDRFLSKHSGSTTGWRYRVLIRLEQGERALAAAEYHALNEALRRHEPGVLESVVLGSGGRWLLSDYRALARCAPAGIADASFFGDVLNPKELAEGSFTKVAVANDEIGAVLSALPGGLDSRETWPLVFKFAGHPDGGIHARVVAAAGRHLQTKSLEERATGEALALLRSAAGSSDSLLREEAMLSVLLLPEGPGRTEFIGSVLSDLAAAGDLERSVSVFLLGPAGGGAGDWSIEQLNQWRGTAGPIQTLARGALLQRGMDSSAASALRRIAASGDAANRLAAVVGMGEGAELALAEVWSDLSLEDKRRWAPSFVRNGGKNRGQLATLAFADKDAVLTQRVAAALGLPGRGNDGAYETALRSGLSVMDPATRAAAAGAAVLRGASSLSPELERLFAAGQDRVMTEALRATLRVGSEGWSELLAAGLAADTPHIRELAVDAAAASCRPEDRKLMLGLLMDEDPHVAVRAASALYLSVGQSAAD